MKRNENGPRYVNKRATVTSQESQGATERGSSATKWSASLLMVGLALIALTGQVFAQALDGHTHSVNPIPISGNATCQQAGYGSFEFKIEQSSLANGSYSIDGVNSVTISTLLDIDNPKTFFDWSSPTLSMDAVIVHGGNNGELGYIYIPESFGDTQLHTPLNDNGKYPTISSIRFCYDYELTAKKTATAQYTRTYTWSIAKSVDPASFTGFVGNTFSPTYTVKVDRTTTDSAWQVVGGITVSNYTPYTVSFSVSDLVASTSATVNCPTTTLTPGQSTTCTYSAGLLGPFSGTNTATVTNMTSPVVPVGNATAQASYVFGDPTTVIGSATVNVTDTNTSFGGPRSTGGNSTNTWTYNGSQSCSSSASAYTNGTYSSLFPNTATITETSKSANTSVTVTCYAPVVKKDATTSYKRTHTWTIDKTVASSSATGFVGDSFNFNYQVSVDHTQIDSDFGVSGSITVTNPNPSAPMTVSVADVVGSTAASLLCGGSLSVPANSSSSCGYSAALGSKTDGTNTATITFNSVLFTGTAAYTFGNPTTVAGSPAINVTDTNGNRSWGPVSDDMTWNYTVTNSCSTDTSTYTNGTSIKPYPNTATITETSAFKTATVQVTCYIPATSKVLKTTTEGPENIGAGPFTFVLSGPASLSETKTLSGAGTLAFASSLKDAGPYTVNETPLPAGWFSNSTPCTFTVSYPGSAGTIYSCSFDNREAARVTVQKYTDGVVNTTQSWTFSLYTGPRAACGVPFTTTNTCSSFLSSPLASSSTFGDTDGILDFGSLNLDPLSTYTVCELNVPPGFVVFWTVPVAQALLPYNPNTSDWTTLTPIGQDLGNRCVDIGNLQSDTRLKLSSGVTLKLTVDNTHPGGSPRTPGYWKNWNTCTGGNQAVVAAKNGGVPAGFYILDNVLPQLVGSLNVTTCAAGVAILDMRQISGAGAKMSNDAAYYLAMELLAAEANRAAGAKTCTASVNAETSGQALLVLIGFNGVGDYLPSPTSKTSQLKKDQWAQARSLAATLDQYNNGRLCQ